MNGMLPRIVAVHLGDFSFSAHSATCLNEAFYGKVIVRGFASGYAMQKGFASDYIITIYNGLSGHLSQVR